MMQVPFIFRHPGGIVEGKSEAMVTNYENAIFNELSVWADQLAD